MVFLTLAIAYCIVLYINYYGLLPYDSLPVRTSPIQLFSKIWHAKLGTVNLINIVKLYYYCYYYTFSF